MSAAPFAEKVRTWLRLCSAAAGHTSATNASGFAIMLLDKNLARRHRRRIPEALLLAFAACFGSLGVLAGMYVCRHKTRKPLFTITVPLLLLAQCAILYFLFR